MSVNSCLILPTPAKDAAPIPAPATSSVPIDSKGAERASAAPGALITVPASPPMNIIALLVRLESSNSFGIGRPSALAIERLTIALDALFSDESIPTVPQTSPVACPTARVGEWPSRSTWLMGSPVQ
ncbi:hypothetical protein D3C81_1688430 [compost metagenome]